MMSEFFDKLIDEEKDLVDTTVIQLQNAKPKHFFGLDCWCYKDKGHWLQSIDIGDYCYGIVWSNDGSIFCWLCMIDEVDQGVPLHHTVAPMYTNDEFSNHILYVHKGKELSEYISRLPNVGGYGQ
jgi:hypothetical protein